MKTFLPALIQCLQHYGYLGLWLSIFIASVGLPLPISFMLLAAGAFAAQGDYNILLLVLLAVSASVAGDSAGFLLGRLVGKQILTWLEQPRRFQLVTPRTVVRSRAYFIKRGGWAIFLSRFLASGLGGTVNLLAGVEHYSYKRFFFYDMSGELLGASIPLFLGYTFASNWETVGNDIGLYSLVLTVLLVALYCVAYLIPRLYKLTRRVQHYRVSDRRATGDI